MTTKHPSVGIIGAGNMARVHAAAWNELGARLSFFTPSGSADIASEFQGTEATSLADLFATTDLIDICAPTPHHADLATLALQADRHVLCEKPLARNVEDARKIIALATERGRVLMPAHVVRYFPQYAAAYEAVANESLGSLAVLRFHRSGARPQRPWFSDEAWSGGIVLDQMIHDIDQAVSMAGPVASVYASENRHDGASGRVQTAHAILTHRSGAVSHCRGQWGAAGTAFSYGFDIAGTRGTLTYDSRKNTGFEMSTVADEGGRSPQDGFLPDLGYMANPYTEQARDFARAAFEGHTPRVTASDGLYAVQLSLAAIQSIDERRVIDIQNEGDRA
ncbi:Gfo/Idh/MocA family oxidoreductase [Diaminobutyricimonas sp. TR449]|uniref:Gfo/Idh/MocA family protein n=1 Tax=Diaminobutyricimonas sp. TR449 TaxID=2708076 RepID=UPI002443C90E|nr:Gfo/Idh/MocA family oxidoreductase [Diaminobutyricimonas sp. TR449]